MQKKSISPWTWKNFWNEFFHSAPRLRIFLLKKNKSEGLVKNFIPKIVSKSSGMLIFFCIQNFISYQATIMNQFIQLKIKSKSLGSKLPIQQRSFRVNIYKHYKSQSFGNEHISGNIRNF